MCCLIEAEQVAVHVTERLGNRSWNYCATRAAARLASEANKQALPRNSRWLTRISPRTTNVSAALFAYSGEAFIEPPPSGRADTLAPHVAIPL
eukprot:1137403-Prymnesium_polylepis.1